MCKFCYWGFRIMWDFLFEALGLCRIYMVTSELDWEGHEAVVLLNIPLEDIRARTEHSLEPEIKRELGHYSLDKVS